MLSFMFTLNVSKGQGAAGQGAKGASGDQGKSLGFILTSPVDKTTLSLSLTHTRLLRAWQEKKSYCEASE